MSHVEIETTLAICSEFPEQIVTEVANLSEVGAFVFTRRPDKTIRDIYLDFSGGELRSRGCGLRLRAVDGKQLITLKGRAWKVPGGGLSREEVELPWSREAVEVIVMQLTRLDLPATLPGAVHEWDNPRAIVDRMGFVPDQVRNTVRRPRDVCREGGATIIAEMVVDSVEYSLQAGTVRHHEIEVEVKGAGTIDDIQEVSNALLEFLPGSLRAWHFGKRATGKAVAAILAEREQSELVSATGNLLPGSYDRLLARLQ